MGNKLGKFPFESVAKWSVTRAGSNVNEKFSCQAIPANDSRSLSGKCPGIQQSKNPNEKAIRPAMLEFGCQESQLVGCRIAPRHAGFPALADHIGTTAKRSARCKHRL
jgi:hypothetical protein